VTSSLGAHAAPLGSNMARPCDRCSSRHRPGMGGCGLGLASGARTLEPVERRMGSTALRRRTATTGAGTPMVAGKGPYEGWRYDGGWGGSYRGWGGSRWRLIIHSHDVPTIAAGFSLPVGRSLAFAASPSVIGGVRLVSNLRRRSNARAGRADQRRAASIGRNPMPSEKSHGSRARSPPCRLAISRVLVTGSRRHRSHDGAHRERAILAVFRTGRIPLQNVTWSEFCDLVRTAARVRETPDRFPRGWGNASIVNSVKKMGSGPPCFASGARPRSR